MPYFDRFDICEAYRQLESDWNVGGILLERGRKYSVGVQLRRMGYKPSPIDGGLSENAQKIYNAAALRMGLIHE